MSKLPTTLWGAINRAKMDLRKFHLEQDPKKKEKLKVLAIASMENADKQVGSGPHKYRSSRHLWRNEILYLSNGDLDDEARGPYWQDTVEHWSIELVPEWARNQSVKVLEPAIGAIIAVQGSQCHYRGHPIYDHSDR